MDAFPRMEVKIGFPDVIQRRIAEQQEILDKLFKRGDELMSRRAERFAKNQGFYKGDIWLSQFGRVFIIDNFNYEVRVGDSGGKDIWLVSVNDAGHTIPVDFFKKGWLRINAFQMQNLMQTELASFSPVHELVTLSDTSLNIALNGIS